MNANVTSAQTDADDQQTPALGLAGLVPLLDSSAAGRQDSDDGTLLLESPVAALQVWLAVEDRPDRIPVGRLPFTIGRDVGCDLVLDDKTVSRRHAQIERAAGVYFLQDLGSSNGLLINDQAVERSLLVSGDQIRIGNLSLSFHMEKDAGTEIELPIKRRRKGAAAAVIAALSMGAIAVLAVRSDWNGFDGLALSGSKDRISQGVSSELPDSVVTASQSVLEAAHGTDTHPASGESEEPDLPGRSAQSDSAVGDKATTSVQVPPKPRVQIAAQSSPALSSRKAQQRVTDQPATERPAAAPASSDSTKVLNASRGPRGTHQITEPEKSARKPVSNKSFDAVEREAKQAYLDMQADHSLDLLRIARSRTQEPTVRAHLRDLQAKIETLVQLNQRATAEYESGHRDQAFELWATFMDTERALFPSRRSGYVEAVAARVVAEYYRSGRQAYAERRFQDAFRMWERASLLDPSGEAASSLLELQDRARELFREGYRLESADLSRAKERWREVLELVPPGSEYHVKARAKLAWYERYTR